MKHKSFARKIDKEAKENCQGPRLGLAERIEIEKAKSFDGLFNWPD